MPEAPHLARRSWLFTPATRPERFAKAAACGADVTIIDLEDAVASGQKSAARNEALGYLARGRCGGPAMALRINSLDMPAGIADLNALIDGSAWPDFVLVPKLQRAGDLQILDRLLTAAASPACLIGMIESAEGLKMAAEFGKGPPRLAGLMFGAADMAADLGTTVAWEPLAYARSGLVAACARCGIAAIDAPYFQMDDEPGLRAETNRAAAFGFLAKAAIHPAQIRIIHETLTPTDAQIDQARAILVENAKGVGRVSGGMIDAAMARRARSTLAAAGLEC